MEPITPALDAQTALTTGQSRGLSKGLPRTPHLDGAQDVNKLRKVAQDFEAVFLGQMLKPMFEGLNATPPFGGGPAEDMWQSLMVDEYGKSIAKAGGVGIADAVMSEMLKMQEVN